MGSLFAGIGGLGLGLGRALDEAWISHDTIWQVEREPFPRAVLAKHWPNADRTVEDVCLASRTNLAPVDIIDGGFPCQDLSYAGKGAGLVEGTRSGLWSEYARLVHELRPRIVVVENVGALLARGVGTVLGDLAALGYDAEWRCIRASDVGAPHRRERLFIVAHRGSEACRGGVGESADAGGEVADADDSRPQGRGRGTVQRADEWTARSGGPARLDDGGHPSAVESSVGVATDGLSGRMARRWPVGPGEVQYEWEAPRTAKGVAMRAAKLRALGNAVVPWVGYEVGRLMMIPALRAMGLA